MRNDKIKRKSVVQKQKSMLPNLLAWNFSNIFTHSKYRASVAYPWGISQKPLNTFSTEILRKPPYKIFFMSTNNIFLSIIFLRKVV